MIGRNSLVQEIRGVRGDEMIFDVGCPCHVAHLCAGKEDKELSVNIEKFVIDIYHNFSQKCKTEKAAGSS